MSQEKETKQEQILAEISISLTEQNKILILISSTLADIYRNMVGLDQPLPGFRNQYTMRENETPQVKEEEVKPNPPTEKQVQFLSDLTKMPVKDIEQAGYTFGSISTAIQKALEEKRQKKIKDQDTTKLGERRY